MIRDVIGLLLICTGGALIFISWYLIKAALIKEGRRLWPPWRHPAELKLANVFVSLGVLILIFGGLVWGGNRPLSGWMIVIVVIITGAVGLLWLDFARPPTQIVITEEVINGDD